MEKPDNTRLYFTSPGTAEIAFEKSEQPTSPGRLTGYFVKWDVLSHVQDGYREVFRQGAFGDLNYGDGIDVKSYQDHQWTIANYLGRTSNGSVMIQFDQVGGRFSIDLPDTQAGRDTAVLAARGDLPGMSFGYLMGKSKWSKADQNNVPVLEHSQGRLIEISPVFDPRFPKTELVLSSLDQAEPQMYSMTSDAVLAADAQRFDERATTVLAAISEPPAPTVAFSQQEMDADRLRLLKLKLGA